MEMEQKTIEWDDATTEDFVKFAAQSLGMPVAPNIGLDTIRAKIRNAYSGARITIMVLPETPEEQAPDAPGPELEIPATADNRALLGTSSKGDPMVKLTIAEVAGKSGKRPAFVSVNGVGMLVPRGRPVDIPYRYYLVLKHAVRTEYEMDEDTHEILSSDIQSYPFSVNVMPPAHAIEAYLAAEA